MMPCITTVTGGTIDLTTTRTTTMTNYSAFENEEYKQTSNTLPFAQIINPRLTKTGILPCGIALTEENAHAVGFKGAPNWEKIDYIFKTGVATPLWITQRPRILIVARSLVYLRERETSAFVGSLKDNYKAWEANKRDFKTFSRAFGFILNDKNELAHDKILSFSLNGASGASFNAGWLSIKQMKRAGFCYEVEEAFAQVQKKTYEAKNGIFHAHCIYQPIMEADERGQGQDTSLVAVTSDYAHPAAKTLKDFLLPPGNDLSALLIAYHNEYKDWKPATPQVEEAPPEDDGYSGRPRVDEKQAYEDVNGYAYADDETNPPF